VAQADPLRIVFLDIDGVLNSERYVRSRTSVPRGELWTVEDIDPEAVRALNHVVERTGAKFVLSSSWRHHHTLDEVAALLRERGFSGELIDVTPRLYGETRGAEIRTWLRVQSTPPSAFAVLDDDAATDGLEPFWIRTDTEQGLTPADAERLAALLLQA
jgi:hypothetical protein